MAIKARSNRTQPSSPARVRDFDDGSHNVDLKNSSYASKHKRKYGAHKLKLQRTRVQVLVAGALLAFLAISFIRSRSPSDGPPRDLVVTGKRTYYQHVPLEYKRRFYVDDDNAFRRTVIRAFRNRGWRKANEPEEAQFVYDKYAWESRFDQLLPWQRYSHFP